MYRASHRRFQIPICVAGCRLGLTDGIPSPFGVSGISDHASRFRHRAENQIKD